MTAQGTGKPRIVVSAVNLVEGGTLAVLQDALRVLSVQFAERYEIVALVHRASLFDVPNVTFLEFPEVKESWLRRLRFEYRDCLPLSRELKPALWLALHDMTPRVEAGVQAVYCHNPAPFYRLQWAEAWIQPKYALFVLLYQWMYRPWIRRNDFVVVQQQWLREEFQRRYAPRAVVVAHPSVGHLEELQAGSAAHRDGEPWRFFYPSLPRFFKNMQVLLAAAAWLEANTEIVFELSLTICGTEERYARKLFAEYGHLRSVRWMGRLSRSEVFEQYRRTDALLFPSRLETWGMPLSEFRRTGKAVFAADLPYARETLAGYAPVHFFDPVDGAALGQALLRWMRGELRLEGAAAAVPAAPFAEDWGALFRLLLGEAG